MGNSAAPSLRILVIDDNADSAEAMALLLELAGHQVRVSHDGPSGLDEARRFTPQVVFCDITMPGMDGYAVAQALRTEPVAASARLVAVSGRVGSADRRRAREAGFEGFLPKPFGGQALLDALQRPVAPARQQTGRHVRP
jgi:two-component system, sensor histidine kinase